MKFDLPGLDCLTKAIRESDSSQSFFVSSSKLLKEIQVWSPSKEILKQEVIVVCNTIVVYIAVKVSNKYGREPSLLHMQEVICKTLERVFQHISKTSDLSSNTWKQRCVAQQIQRICDAVKDPIIHFRSLDVLSLLVTLCGLACLFLKVQNDNNALAKRAYSVFQEITVLLCKDVLQEPVPYKNGLLTDSLPEECCEASPCVQDLVCLILCPCPGYEIDWSVAFTKWQWLDKLCYCKHLMRSYDYFSAMEQLEALLSTQLDSGVRSIVLCMFAQCYMHQGCPQLALQTYKTALKVDKSNHMIFFYLSKVYGELQEADLELESLNLLVKLLTSKHLQSEELTPDLHLDALVFSVWKIAPTLSLVETLYHFAKRCIELKRYTEASEQFMTLLKLLEKESECTFISNPTVCNSMNVQEVVVEAAEASALAHQVDQCLGLFDQFYTVLAIDETAPMSVSRSLDARNPNLSPTVEDNSPDILFSPCHSMACCQPNSFLKNDTKVTAETIGGNVNVKSFNGESTSTYFENLCDLTKRKRKRSESVTKDELEVEKNGHAHEQDLAHTDIKDPWWSLTLAVRLLLSKADVLVLSQGYNEEVMSCLHRAQALLLKEETPIFVEDLVKNVNFSYVDAMKSPSHKRMRILSDQQESVTAALPENRCQSKTFANQYKISQLWSNAMVKVAERLLKATLSHGQALSARNSAKLLLQLEPDNINAQQALNQPLVLKDHEDSMAEQNMTASGVL